LPFRQWPLEMTILIVAAHPDDAVFDSEYYCQVIVRIGSYKLEFCRASRRIDSVIANVAIKKLDE
jgi:hypothetical protein